jgi:hypothetical protein
MHDCVADGNHGFFIGGVGMAAGSEDIKSKAKPKNQPWTDVCGWNGDL